MVVGSPKQRHLLPGVSHAQAWEWTATTFRDAVKRAEDRGVTICLEPLAPAETNFINTAAEAIEFAYRRATLPKGVVVGVWLQLRSGVRADIEKVVKDYLHYRRDTQPLTLPSAGCVFKNPLNDSAGRVVEATGFKGTSVGDAQVSTKHANFIVNQGQASASDVLSLIKKIRTGIMRKTGIKLELELKIVGEV